MTRISAPSSPALLRELYSARSWFLMQTGEIFRPLVLNGHVSFPQQSHATDSALATAHRGERPETVFQRHGQQM
jgi:hypothetical protein